jgi:redox-sensitive bicupin YhaK (pirin superfamily)
MKKEVVFTSEGSRADIGSYRINRMFPNRYVDAIGPFVLLDHLLPVEHPADGNLQKANGTGAHPHRGIATLTYLFDGEAVHLDSKGHYATVHAGGAQWMKAGNGIIHDEAINVDTHGNSRLTHGLQFWINLPAKNKAESAEYIPLQESNIPKMTLKDNSGWIKVIAGEFEGVASVIPSYSQQFLYHIHLENGKHLSMPTSEGFEYAAFLPLNRVTINATTYGEGEFITFENSDGTIEFNNDSGRATDIILFGGEPYTEPIVAQGPFVMNTQKEISQAYNDFFYQKYGQIDYSVVTEK